MSGKDGGDASPTPKPISFDTSSEAEANTSSPESKTTLPCTCIKCADSGCQDSVVNGRKRKCTDTDEVEILRDHSVYPKGGLSYTQHGVIFQVYMLMIILMESYKNCKNKVFERFRLATEMDEAGQLDDGVLQSKVGKSWRSDFMQFKHEEQLDIEEEGQDKNASVTEEQLLSTDSKGRFALPMYFMSYAKIQRRLKDKSVSSFGENSIIDNVVLCTNIPLAPDTPFIDVKDEVSIFTNLSKIHTAFQVKKIETRTSQVFLKNLHGACSLKSDFNQLVMMLVDSIQSKTKIPDDPLVSYYLFPLVKDVFEISEPCTDLEKETVVKFRKEFINGHCKENQMVMDLRDALIREIYFRKVSQWEVQLDPNLGVLSPKDEEEIAKKLRGLHDKQSPLEVRSFPYAHVFIRRKLLGRGKMLKRVIPSNLAILKKELSKCDGAFQNIDSEFGRPFHSAPMDDLEKLSEGLYQGICKNKNNSKLSSVTNEIQQYQFDLLAEVLEGQNPYTLRRTFVEVKPECTKVKRENQNISASTLQLRGLLVEKLFTEENKDELLKCNSDEVLRKSSTEILKNCRAVISETLKKKIKLVNDHCKKSCPTSISGGIYTFGEKLSTMIRKQADKKNCSIEITKELLCECGLKKRQGRPPKETNGTVSQLDVAEPWWTLAGNVFVKRGNKVVFSSSFLKSSERDKGIYVDVLRRKLLETLDPTLLANCTFNVEKSMTPWKEGASDRELPSKLTSTEVDEFIRKVRIVLSPSRVELSKVLPQYFAPNLSRFFCNFVSPSDSGKHYTAILMESMMSWLAERTGTFYTYVDAQDIFGKVEGFLASTVLKSIGACDSSTYKFKRSGTLEQTWFADTSLLHLRCEKYTLTYARLVSTSAWILAFDLNHFKSPLILDLIRASASSTDLSSYMLLVHIDCRKMDEQTFRRMLNNIIDCCKIFRKVVFVSENDDKNASKFMQFKPEIRCESLSTTFADLADESQCALLNTECVVLSGGTKTVSLRLCLGLKEGFIPSEIGNILSECVIDTVVHNGTIPIGSKPDIFQRTSATLLYINVYMAFDERSAVELFVNEQMEKDSIVYIEGDFRAKSNIIALTFLKARGKFPSAFYLQENLKPKVWEYDFEKFLFDNQNSRIVRLASINNSTIHWKCVYDPELYIKQAVKFEGTCTDIMGVEKKCKDDIRQNKFRMIISGKAGIGKTCALDDLHNRWCQNRWVVKKDLGSVNARGDVSVTPESHFLDVLFRNKFEKDIATFRLNTDVSNDALPMCFILDAFDSINDTKTKGDTLQIFEDWRSKANFVVTAQEHEKTKLEKALQVSTATLLGFENRDQVSYLERLWTTRHSSNLKGSKAKKLLEYLDFVLKLPILKGQSLGTPLQLRMIGDVLWPDLQGFIQNNDYRPEVNIKKVTDLFSSFINRKFDMYFKLKRSIDTGGQGGPDSLLSESDKSFLTQEYTKWHQFIACRMILSKTEFERIFDAKSTELFNKSKDVYNVGIVSASFNEEGTEIQHFFHDTVAEYYVADFLLKRLKKRKTRKGMVTFINKILKTESKKRANLKQYVKEMVESDNEAQKLLGCPQNEPLV